MKANIRTLIPILCLSFFQSSALWAESKPLPLSPGAQRESLRSNPPSLHGGPKSEPNSQSRPQNSLPTQTPEQQIRTNEIKRLQEGAGSSNGGNVVQSDAVTRFLDMVREATEAPFIPGEYSAFETLQKNMALNPGFAVATIFQEYYGPSASVGNRVLTALGQLNFVLVNVELPDLQDQGIVVLNWNFKGTIKRLALQHRDTKTVLVDRNLLLELITSGPQGQTDVAAFLMHEALIRIYYDNSLLAVLPTTEKISNIVTIAFGKDPIVSQLSGRALALMMNRAGIPTSSANLPGLKSYRFQVREMTNSFADAFYAFFNKSGQVAKLSAGDFVKHDYAMITWPLRQKNEKGIEISHGEMVLRINEGAGANPTHAEISLDNPDHLGGKYFWDPTKNEISFWQ